MASALVRAAFFGSGFAALLYQVIWQRILTIFSGADVYSATIVVAAFMAGLGIGNLAGGHVADRVSRRVSLMLFCVAELAIAAFGFFSGSLFYDVLYQRLGSLDLSQGAVAGVLLLSLLWPTCFMGASLPLLAKAITRSLDTAAPSIGVLYGVNTLGAAFGAFLSTWLLLPRYGLAESLVIGATLNLGCALTVLPLARVVARDRSGPPTAHNSAHSDEVTSQPGSFPLWASLYALSGLLALSFEIIWFRLLGVMMKATAFTFGTLLALYLAGLAVGSLAGSGWARRIKRPAVAVLLLQAGVGLSAAIGLNILLVAAASVPELSEHFAAYEPLDIKRDVTAFLDTWQVPKTFVLLYVIVPSCLVLAPTVLMGMSFPVLQRLVHSDLSLLGRRVGTLLLMNIGGSMLGAVVTGWFLLDWLGSANVLRLLTAACALVAVAGCVVAWRETAAAALGFRRVYAPAAVALAFIPLVALMPDAASLWSRLHGALPWEIVFGEDASGLSLVKLNQPGFPGRQVVFVNGLGQSTIPYGDIHTALGAVPAFVHGTPRQVAIVGLGSGDTAHSAAGHPAIEQVTCIEIVRQQRTTLDALNQIAPDSGVTSLLANPRIAHVFGDGRAYLLHQARRFDLIEADALRPNSAYSGNLYSDGYFELARTRLSPNGIVASWAATQRVTNTFLRVFPYVLHLGEILIGSNEPIRLDRAAIMAQVTRPEVVEYYDRVGTDIVRLVEHFLRSPRLYGPDDPREALAEINTDLDPRDEFDLGFR